YEEIDGGFIAFGGNSKRGKITGKGKIKTSKLDFENVYFVKELKFNLFSVSQMYDKKNSVSFTDTGCVVLSPNFKLTDESYVLLKVPRKDNMYIVDLKNVIPKGGLTCLFTKATPDESNLWHRRLGHVNFKTMNKLKGKQHKASCKTKTVSSISQPLKMLHMDLFVPTFVKSLMKKMYCLVIINDFSRFSWVFFLATKDETFEILKTLIAGIKNLIDLNVKVIRCDNGTEFKNRVMNQLCEMKGIKREFSVAKTPQQNKVAERKTRTLIEAVRTMLADSKLPTTFWAEAVNTACYVQNRVLVIKPHNKTPYELFLGRKPTLSFMKPFGYPVTILNTIDHLGSGPNWLFDIDALTKSINYKPVVVGNQSNGNAGTKACADAGKARVETMLGKDYILLPLWTQDSPFSSSSNDSPDARFKPSGDNEKNVTEEPGKEGDDSSNDQEKDDYINSTNNINIASDGNNTNNVNAVSLTINVVVTEVNDVDLKTSIELPNDPNMPELKILFIQMMMKMVLSDFLLHCSSINNSASLSNKFGESYFIFKFGISYLLHQVVITIADRIRDVCLRQELLKYMVVHVNDASESSKPSWRNTAPNAIHISTILEEEKCIWILIDSGAMDFNIGERDKEILYHYKCIQSIQYVEPDSRKERLFFSIVQFSENTSNIVGSGPNWLFDIDALTKSMNYKPVVAGNQSNGNAGTKACDNAGKARVETVPGKDYILLPLWTQDPPFSSSSKDSPDVGFKPSGRKRRMLKIQGMKVEIQLKGKIVSNGNNTNNVNAVSSTVNAAGTEVNAVDPKTSIKLLNDLNMPELEDIESKSWNRSYARRASSIQITKVLDPGGIYQMEKAIGTKWVYRNKKDERGIVIKSKARLVSQGYIQEEGIDYDEMSRVLSYGKFEEEVNVYQPPGFEDPDFPNRVYKVEKALYGLHQALRAWYETLSTYLLENGFQRDANGEDVDEHMYRSMIGSLVYLTSSRPDIMFVVCVCARFQVNPKVSHLLVMKRIFRYLKSQPKLGLWYSKDSPFDLVAYTDSDYVGASLDRKSTTGGCQFLGYRLISWQCKKQIVVANSTIEAEYVDASSCYGQVLWIQNQLLDYGYNFMHTKIYIDNESTKGIGVNAGDSKLMLLGINLLLLEKVNVARHNLLLLVIVDFLNANPIKYALTVNPTIYTSCIEQFWATTKVKTINGEVQLQALVDGKKVIITETSVRRDLQLEDAEGIECLPNADIFEQLALIGYEKPSQKLTFYKAFFSPQWKFLIHTILQCLIVVKSMYPRFEMSFLAKQVGDMSNHDEIFVTPSHTKKVFGNMKRVRKGFSEDMTLYFQPVGSRSKEEMVTEPIADEAANEENVPTQSNDPPLSRVNTLGSREDRLKLKELMKLCTKLFDRVLDLKTTKTGQAKEIASLKKREDASKQGRKIDDIDQDAEVTLVDETQGRYDGAQMFDIDVFNGEEVFVAEQIEKVVEEVVSTAEVSATATITTEEITLAQALAELRSAKPKIVVQEPVQSTTKSFFTTTNTELAFKLQAKEDEQARLAREKAEKVKEANISWDNVQAMIEANRLLVERLQEREQEELTNEEKVRLFIKLLEKRKKHFAALRAQEKRNKPPTKAQKKSTMLTYLKNMAGYKQCQLKNKSFAEIQKLFDKAMTRVNRFVDMDTELVKESSKKAEEEMA
ncbi:putative ribonuclease H-like domain-containing protein, partial [Tanacetum coccineum]